MTQTGSKQPCNDTVAISDTNSMEVGIAPNMYFNWGETTKLLFLNCFSHVEPDTVKTWLQTFAVWHNPANQTLPSGKAVLY
jgi:hypothetical protein